MEQRYPLVFGFRDAVSGKGYLAGVQLNGRALMEQEDDEWWVSGVEPGGLTASGATPAEAYHNFRRVLTLVLFDSAELAASFEAFEHDVRDLCGQRNDKAAARWTEAREAIRGGAKPGDSFLDELPRITKEIECGVNVTRLDNTQRAFSPLENEVDQVYLTAA